MGTITRRPTLVLIGFVISLYVRGSFSVASEQVSVSGGSWGPVTQGFQAGMELSGSSASPEAPAAALRLTLRNVTSEPLQVAQTYPEHDYRLTLRNADGDTIPPTRDASEFGGRVTLVVQPGEAIVEEYDFTKMYGVFPDGDYSVVARRYVFRLDGEGCSEVESNPMTIAMSGGKVSQELSASGASPAAKVESASQPPLVAVRAILERHGFQVAWDANGRALRAAKGSSLAVIAAGSSVMSFAGQDLRMGREARLIEGRLCAPGNAISLLTASAG